MVKLLIIEDDLNKSKQLREILQKRWTNLNIEEKRSYQSGLKSIMQGNYHLILLDMSMPTYDNGERYRAFAGRDILYQMIRKKINIKTIVVTQFETFGDDNKVSLEELRESLEKNCNDIYSGIVHYNAALTDWKEELLFIIEKIINDI